MTNRKRIFSFIISLLLTTNMFVGPLSAFFAGFYTIFPRLFSEKLAMAFSFLILLLGFYIIIRSIQDIPLMRKPLFVLSALSVMILLFWLLLIFLGAGYGPSILFFMSVPLIFISVLYCTYLLVHAFVQPQRRYLVSAIVMILFLLSMIVIKNKVIIEEDCRYGGIVPLAYQRYGYDTESVLDLFIQKKCKFYSGLMGPFY